MSVEVCKCGKASIKYDCVGEDSFEAEYFNTKIVKDGYGRACICKSCGEKYDNFDPCMVRILTEVIHPQS